MSAKVFIPNEAVRSYLDEVSRTALLTPSQEKSLARRVRRGDDAARDHLVRANLRLVVSVASKMKGSALDLLDRIQEGNRGLLRAVEKFDPERGLRFSTYATWWIRQGISRALSNSSRSIRLPVHMAERAGQLRNEEQRLTTKLGRAPTIEELGEACGVEPDLVQRLRAADRPLSSLDAPTRAEGSHVVDTLVDEATADPLMAATDQSLRRDLAEALGQLEETDQRVLRDRFGLDTRVPLTLEQLGRKLGISRERVRQIETRALARLKALAGSRLASWSRDPGNPRPERN